MRAILIQLAALTAVAFSAGVQQPLFRRSSSKHMHKLSGHSMTMGRGPQKTLASLARTSSQPIIDYSDTFYVTNITIGTPGQTLSVVIDTGAANVLVVDDLCHKPGCTGSPDFYTRHIFDTMQSSTLYWEIAVFYIYGDDSYVKGDIALDTITLGGLTLHKQPIGLVSDLSDNYAYYPYDGVLGLGWPNEAIDYPDTTVMLNLLPQLDLPLFTIWLDRHVLPLENTLGGLITYGALDAYNCDAQVSYVTLSTKRDWQFAINGFSVGGGFTYAAEQALSDTAYSSIGAPSTAFNKILSSTNATYDFDIQHYVVPCSGDFPDLAFVIGGHTLYVPANEYVLDLGFGHGRCGLMVNSIAKGSGFSASWILGDPFIRTYCHVYDIGNARIGFARAHHTKELKTTSG